MRMRGQAQLRRVVHEGFIDHQPATTPGEPRVPVEQSCRGQAQAGRIVRVDHHQHVEAVDKEVDFLLQHFTHDVATASPGFGMFGVTWRQHADLAGAP
ncbi:hypothetical protein D3C78_1656160 [compost metagenome]